MIVAFSSLVFSIAAAGASNAAAAASKMSLAQKLHYIKGSGDIISTISNIAIVFSFLIFAALFIKRWKIPRMGYFLVSTSILISRFMMPNLIFWRVAAISAGFFSFVMFFLSHRNIDFDSRKEPLYFLFNAFTLFIITTPMNLYVATFATISLLSSLFFVTTKKPTRRGKFTQLDADDKIMESLEKRVKRPL